jgi:hypothetical protein
MTGIPKRKALGLGVLLALGLAALSLASPAWGAATLAVDRTDDNSDPTTSTACTSAPNDCSLRGAIVLANHVAGTDTITVPAGTYTLTLAGTGDFGDLDIASDMTIKGAGARTTKVVGGSSFDNRIFQVQPSVNATVSGLTITGGKLPAAPFAGGGVANEGNLTLDKVSVTKNTAPQAGGIFSQNSDTTTNGSSLKLTNSTISRNSAVGSGFDFTGGGLWVVNGGTATITNSTISGNRADGIGGGVLAEDGAHINILNSTIASNSSPVVGGGIAAAFSGTHVLVKNTIVSANTQTNCGTTAHLSDGISSQGHNISSDNSCHFTQTGDTQNTNPRIGLLANNGGPTDTRALLTGSPAIDTATNNGCPPKDQRGKARPKDGNGDGNAICDKGAYEK